MNIKLKSLSVELIFLSVETESVHLRVRVPVLDYRRLYFTAESDLAGTFTRTPGFARLKIAPWGHNAIAPCVSAGYRKYDIASPEWATYYGSVCRPLWGSLYYVPNTPRLRTGL